MSSFTNKKQFDFLVEWMCKHPQLPRNQLKLSEVKELYEELAFELNRLGPPHKPQENWRKVWRDLRWSTKRKLRNYMMYGCDVNFSAREESVIELLDMRSEVEQSLRSKTKGLRTTKSKVDKLNESEEVFCNDSGGYDYEDVAGGSLFDEMSQTDNNKIITNDDGIENCFDDTTEFDMPEDCVKSENPAVAITNSTQLNVATGACPIDLLKKQIQLQEQQLTQQQHSLRVLGKIEKQLNKMNQTEEHSVSTLEENNKLLKLLIYRSTMLKNANDPVEKSNSEQS